MAYGGGQGIGGVGRQRSVELENAFHHELHLRLFRAARADHGLLDLPRRVFEHFGVCVGGTADGGAARLTQFQRAVGIAIDEHPLDGDFMGPVLGHDGLDAAKNLAQPIGKFARLGADHAACHIRQPGSHRIQDAKPRALGTGIDAQHAQRGRFSAAQPRRPCRRPRLGRFQTAFFVSVIGRV